MGPFRVYFPDECGADGYPLIWHRNCGELLEPSKAPGPADPVGALDNLIYDEIMRTPGTRLSYQSGIKHLVRAQANHRCLRCRHPFVVGESGVMEGPMAVSKAFAAELGVNQEALDLALEEVVLPSDLSVDVLDKAPRTNWSACDEYCRHGGPIRARGIGEWETHEEVTQGALDLLISAGAEVEAAWRILTVHHLDEVKGNLRWWNLVALCQRCHLLIQRKVTMESPWPWEHTDWFKPYDAAWYALRYLGEDLDRDETMARLEELLALGRREESIERMPL